MHRRSHKERCTKEAAKKDAGDSAKTILQPKAELRTRTLKTLQRKMLKRSRKQRCTKEAANTNAKDAEEEKGRPG